MLHWEVGFVGLIMHNLFVSFLSNVSTVNPRKSGNHFCKTNFLFGIMRLFFSSRFISIVLSRRYSWIYWSTNFRGFTVSANHLLRNELWYILSTPDYNFDFFPLHNVCNFLPPYPTKQTITCIKRPLEFFDAPTSTPAAYNHRFETTNLRFYFFCKPVSNFLGTTQCLNYHSIASPSVN